MAALYRFRFRNLDVYRVALEHFEWVCAVVERMPRGPWKVVNQCVGAALSIMGNIGEANGRERKPGEVEQHYRYAQGSTYEAATHLDALVSLGVISSDEYAAANDRLARIAAMLTSLMKRQRRIARAKRSRPSMRRASGVPEGAERPTGIDAREAGPEASAASQGSMPAPAGPRGSEATEGDRPS